MSLLFSVVGKPRIPDGIVFFRDVIVSLGVADEDVFDDIFGTGSRKLIDFFQCPYGEAVVLVIDVLPDGERASSVTVSGDVPIGGLLQSVHEAVFDGFWDEVDVFSGFSGFGVHLLFFDESARHRFGNEGSVASSAMRVGMGDGFRFNQFFFFFESLNDRFVNIQNTFSCVIVHLFIKFSVVVYWHKKPF